MELKEIFTIATRLSGLSCPKCVSTSLRKHGKCNSIQRYQCKDCGRTFVETVNTPIHWIHNKEKMQKYVATMLNKNSIRTAAEILEISKDTSFSWRHKILSSLQAVDTTKTGAPTGICEIKLPHSDKGKHDKTNEKMPDSRTLMFADARGITTLHHLQGKNKISETVNLITKSILPSTEIGYIKTNLLTRASRKIEQSEIKHTKCKQNITGQAIKMMKDLNKWMARFNGVATKYLQQYWNWYRIETNTGNLEKFEAECFGQRQLILFRKLIVL